MRGLVARHSNGAGLYVRVPLVGTHKERPYIPQIYCGELAGQGRPRGPPVRPIKFARLEY